MRRFAPLLLALTLAACASTDRHCVATFEQEADAIRRRLHIPGMSVAIVRDQQVLWTRGFGHADLENGVPVTPDTLFHIASVTKTIGATLLLQLVEKGQLSLEEPIAKYPPSRWAPPITDERVQIRHILSHTSAGTPGDRHVYDGARYDAITQVIEEKYGVPFREVITERVLEPLHMTESVPSHDVIDDPQLARRYAANLARFAKPYSLYGKGDIIRASWPDREAGASAGLLSTVGDLAKFDAAIDGHVLLQPKTQELARTPFLSNAGERLPYGLGWFVQEYRGERLIWHTGNWGSGYSATYLKVPARNLSLILLANSEALSSPFYATGGMETNPIACAFLRHFVFQADDPCREVGETARNKWLAERAAAAEATVALDLAVAQSYAGQYQLNEKRTFTVTREGTRLFIDMPRRDDRLELFPSPQGDFFFKVPTPTRVRFVREGALVTTLEFHFGEGEEPMRAKKVR